MVPPEETKVSSFINHWGGNAFRYLTLYSIGKPHTPFPKNPVSHHTRTNTCNLT